VLGRLRALPGPEHEVVAFDQVDADPGVGLDAVVQHLDGLPQDLVGLALAVDDPVDRLEGAAIRVRRRAHSTGTACSTSAPSKSATVRRYSAEIGVGRRSGTATSTMVWSDVHMRTSSSTRTAQSS
jgi:hypothetical protein